MSQRQFCLFPGRRDERRAALHGAQAVLEDTIGRLDSLAALRHAAREAVVTRFDWSVITARLEKIYLDVIGRVHTA